MGNDENIAALDFRLGLSNDWRMPLVSNFLDESVHPCGDLARASAGT